LQRCEFSRFARCAQAEIHLANPTALLLPRRVKQRLDFFALSFVFGVRHDANNLHHAFVAPDSDALTEHIFVGKELARKGLVDDGDLRRTRLGFSAGVPLSVLMVSSSPLTKLEGLWRS